MSVLAGVEERIEAALVGKADVDSSPADDSPLQNAVLNAFEGGAISLVSLQARIHYVDAVGGTTPMVVYRPVASERLYVDVEGPSAHMWTYEVQCVADTGKDAVRFAEDVMLALDGEEDLTTEFDSLRRLEESAFVATLLLTVTL